MLLAGCGEAKYEYVSNVDEQTYYKVPKGYTEVTEEVDELDNFYLSLNVDSATALILRNQRWSKVYDASVAPSSTHLITPRRTPQPVIYSVVQHLLPRMQAIVSYNYMRDYLWPPVTEGARKTYEDGWKEAIETGAVPPGQKPYFSNFEALDDQLLAPSDGIHGLRTIFNYEVADGSVNTFDLTIYTNNDSSVLYALLIRCEFKCYLARKAEFDDIATSFTVRSKA